MSFNTLRTSTVQLYISFCNSHILALIVVIDIQILILINQMLFNFFPGESMLFLKVMDNIKGIIDANSDAVFHICINCVKNQLCKKKLFVVRSQIKIYRIAWPLLYPTCCLPPYCQWKAKHLNYLHGKSSVVSLQPERGNRKLNQTEIVCTSLAVSGPSGSSSTLWYIIHSSQFCVICKLAEAMLFPIIQFVNEGVKQEWTQY